ncbi:MAG: ribose 5-phosphate isomerase B [Bacilli bacterium]|jgi:ribose 5-phosphate isomerase B|nr:ribose 5-phosphate isomerase B [Bacilli bacterium]
MNRIVIGCDHGGFEYKEMIKEYLLEKDYEIIDAGCYDKSSVDYPDVALKVANTVNEENVRGIIICGTGIGISISANKCHGIRAALCLNEYMAKMARNHNDSNVLALGQRVMGIGLALSIVDTWLEATFDGGRHENRVHKMMKMEGE